jgi:hypothetical protein
MTKTERVTKAEAERELGRPCPHSAARGAGYCRSCANSVAHKRMRAREVGDLIIARPAPRVTRAQAVAILGRPCKHDPKRDSDYCGPCAHRVAAHRCDQRRKQQVSQ